MKRLLLALLLMAVTVFADDAWDVPLPRQSAYVAEGFSVGLGVGLYNPAGGCDCMGVWQGQFDYYYTKHVSGGADIRFFGGDLDKNVMLMYQRYRVNARYHWPLAGSLDIYGAAILGLETTNFTAIRKDIEGDEPVVDTLDFKKSCEKKFALDGFTVGAEFGLGWAFSKYFGAIFSSIYELSFHNVQLLTLTPGLAFDLREFWPWAKKNIRSTWISLEFGPQKYFNRGVGNWSYSFYLGLEMGL